MWVVLLLMMAGNYKIHQRQGACAEHITAAWACWATIPWCQPPHSFIRWDGFHNTGRHNPHFPSMASLFATVLFKADDNCWRIPPIMWVNYSCSWGCLSERKTGDEEWHHVCQESMIVSSYPDTVGDYFLSECSTVSNSCLMDVVVAKNSLSGLTSSLFPVPWPVSRIMCQDP